MKFKIMNRQLLSAAIFIFYLLPLLFFSAYSISMMSPHKSWALLSLGLSIIVICSLALILMLIYWEESIKPKKNNTLTFPDQSIHTSMPEKENKVMSLEPSLIFNQLPEKEPTEQIVYKENDKELNLLQTALNANQEQLEELAKLIDLKNQELQQKDEEKKDLEAKALQISQDFADYKLFSEEQLKQKQLQLSASQQTMEDLRTEMEKREKQISQLDTKIHDLSYEIKTLLYLHEEEAAPIKSSLATKDKEISRAISNGTWIESHEIVSTLSEPKISLESPVGSTIQNSFDAVNLLKKCINMAQKLTGANYHSNESSRYREFTSSYYTIDQRRLFDNLRSETGALILVYSQKDLKLLFVNNDSKSMLGWSPEKFIADFPSILQEGMNDWKKAISLLPNGSDTQVRLLAKTKQGQEVLLNCHLGAISTGLFRNHVIGVLYPA